MWLNETVNSVWCAGEIFTKQCTPYEAIGLWLVFAFYTIVIIVTMVHECYKENNQTSRNMERNNNLARSPDLMAPLIFLTVYFFVLVIGCLLWAIFGIKAVHPFQFWPVQIVGSVIIFLSILVFIQVHLIMGKNWTLAGQPSVAAKLVTTNVFSYCRHPMYSSFIWACLGSLLATLNWLIFWCMLPAVFFTLSQLEQEQRTLESIFGREYLNYAKKVPALGFPWDFLWDYDQYFLENYEPLVNSSE